MYAQGGPTNHTLTKHRIFARSQKYTVDTAWFLIFGLVPVVSDHLGPLGRFRGVPCPKVLYTRPGQLRGGTRIRRHFPPFWYWLEAG